MIRSLLESKIDNYFIRVLKFLGNLVFFGVPALTLVYLIIILNRKRIPFTLVNRVENGLLLILDLGYLLFLLAFLLLKIKSRYRFLIAVIAVLMASFFCFQTLGGAHAIGCSASTDTKIYHMTNQSSLLDLHGYYNLFECDSNDLNCRYIYFDSGSIALDCKLVIENGTNYINLITNDKFKYSIGDRPRYILNNAEFDENYYSLARIPLEGEGGYEFHLYKCNLDFTTCEPMPFIYIQISPDGPEPAYVYPDEETGQLNVWDYQDNLIFSYKDSPECFVEGCSIPQD